MSIFIILLNLLIPTTTHITTHLVANHDDIDTSWHQIKTTLDYTIYTRSSTSSSIKEVKAVGKMNAQFDAVKKALSSIEAYPEWVYNCVKAYRFDAKNDHKFYTYTRTDLPFPFSDRELVVYTELKDINQDEWQMISDNHQDKLPLNSKIVRINNYHTKWSMKKTSDSTIDYSYTMAMDPGGRIPSWLVNMAIDRLPMKIIKELQKRSMSLSK